MITTDDLLAKIKRDSYLTTAQYNLTDQELLDVANDETIKSIVPLVLSLREGYYREAEDVVFIAGVKSYPLPEYATYGILELVSYFDSNNNPLPYQINRADPADLQWLNSHVSTGRPQWFHADSYNINVYPTPTTSEQGEYIRVWYDRRISQMVPTSSADVVASVVSNTVTFSNPYPSTFVAGALFDVYSSKPPYPMRARSIEALTAPTPSSLTFSVDDLVDVSDGDYFCLKNETVFLPCPEELMSFISDLTILSLARTQQDSALLRDQKDRVIEEVTSMLRVMGQRIKDNPKRVRLNQPLMRGRNLWWLVR